MMIAERSPNSIRLSPSAASCSGVILRGLFGKGLGSAIMCCERVLVGVLRFEISKVFGFCLAQ